MRRKVISCMICALMITTILVIEVPEDVSAQVTEEWVARYNSPENRQDVAYAIAIDPFGNIYVTGQSYNAATGDDYLTIAYDSSGNELWVARYNSPRSRTDHAWAIATDSVGNVYVTGESDGDYATIAYNSSGSELWVARYNGPVSWGDGAESIAIGSSGNVYVTGWSNGGSDTYYDYATVAYDSSGNELWVTRYNSPGNGDDWATDIAVDSSENIYVTGGASPEDDYVTVAYSSSGEELWAARYNGPENGFDKAHAIATDSSGNVYVTGWSQGLGANEDYTTVAYNSSGNELWVARYDGPRNGLDEAYAIAVDPSGNVHVTGRSKGIGTNEDYAIVAYDSSGNELWVARYNGPGNYVDVATDIALDSFGNVYVTGWSDGGTSKLDYATVAYDSSGNELWVARYNNVENKGDRAEAIAVDSSGNVYVTGDSWKSETWYDCVTIKYSQEPFDIQTTIDIDPDTLNLKSKGRWITAYITLNSPYDINDIDISTLVLEDTIPAEWGDIQNNTLMFKFDRNEVEDMLSPGIYNLKVTGELTDGTSFEGYSDEIRVIDPGK